jgi:glutathione S-transferase
MSDLTLYQLGASPNSIKVRLALSAKKLPFETVECDPMDRAKVLEVSGQPLLPVLKDGDRVIYDSYAIMRYVEANWRDNEPRLFDAGDRERMHKIEEWELFARTQLGECLGMVVRTAFSSNEDFNAASPPAAAAEVFATAKRLMGERIRKLEEQLNKSAFLMSTDGPNAADLTCAPFAKYGFVDDAPEGSISAIFAKHTRLPDSEYPKVVAWLAKIMALAD